MDKLTLPAPAKINRFLHVLEQRPDGYHSIQTLFHLIDFSDQLTFTLRKDNKICVSTRNASISEQQNLAFRAAKILQASSKKRLGVDIVIDKKIPISAGLGGGSSDAATTLHALNLLWGLELSPQQLAEVGLQIGADVPLFIMGKNGLGRRYWRTVNTDYAA